MAQIKRDPTTQPGPKEPRLAWMAWEQLWEQAAQKADIHLLAQLVGMQVDTPEKQTGAERVLEYYANNPRHYEGKLARLLLTHGARVPDHLVAPLCACGMRAIKLMDEHGANFSATNYAGENCLALACCIPDADQFKQAWAFLRGKGLDPAAMDDSKETALDAADHWGHGEHVEQAEAMLLAQHQASRLDQTTTKSRGKPGKSRL